MKYSLIAIAVVMVVGFASPSLATNVLTNPSFENPDTVTVGNHIGTFPTGWSIDAGAPNLVRAGDAFEGSQYVDLTGGATYLYQTFTLTTPRVVSFGGWFSPRDGNTGGGNAAIYDATNTVMQGSASPYVSGTGHTNPWLQSQAVSPLLAAGTYTYRGIFDEAANIDSAFVDTVQLSASTGPGPFSPYTPSNSDLLQTSLGSVNANSDFLRGGTESLGGISVLNNGSFLINGGNPADNSEFAGVGDNDFVEFQLDLATSPLGYVVNSIDIYGGWNDSGRDRQLYGISYMLVGDPTLYSFDSLDFNPAAGGDPSAVRALFGTELTGVRAIRFDFLPGQENGWAGIGEIDVIGAAVPEPSSFVLLALGLGTLALGARRRRLAR